ncbi:hypothetical protein SAMN05216267_105225 [Actinacidiphila rubida]|uniref:Integral membrane protein n=1 Tax=Actinacidiphila rubida TaxID=310780 RepID=A0A1H8TFB8_9ACTN|nr:hypothetical protein [Actinacidiphila rubida]SEO89571.1 hypothetical protein SAMN05216267_105225 [Actinacidiphila rubida]
MNSRRATSVTFSPAGARRPRRALLWGLVLLAASTLGALLLAGPAHADPTAPTPRPATSTPAPTTTPTPQSSAAGPTAAPGAGAAAEPVPSPPSTVASPRQVKVFNGEVFAYRKQLAHSGIMSAFNVSDSQGIPLAGYDVAADTGDWKSWDLKVEAFLVDLMFTVTKVMIAFACWLVAWSLSFSLANILLGPVIRVSDSLYTNVMVQMGLPGLFLTFSAVTACWHLMFGDRSRGWGEAGASIVISALAVTVLAAPPQLLLGPDNGAVGKARQLAVATAVLVLGQDQTSADNAAADASSLAQPITDRMVDAFIVQPDMLLTYGQTFTGDCATQFSLLQVRQASFDAAVARQTKIIHDMPSSLDLIPVVGDTIDDAIKDQATKWALNQFGPKTPTESFEASCVQGDAGQLRKASFDKVGGAFFMMIAALMVVMLVVTIDFTFLMAQVWVALEAIIARCALVIGILPGSGRSYLWDRATAIIRSLALMVLTVAGLAVFLVTITAIMDADAASIPGGLTIRFVVIDLLCIAAFVYRRRLLRASKSATSRVRARLSSSKLGGSPARIEQGTRGSLGGRLLRTSLMVGALAATGGTSAAMTSGIGRAGAARALTGRLAASGRGLASAATGTVKAGLGAGKFGLKATVGLPVYGPRAYQAADAAIRAMPGQAVSAADALRTRLQRHVAAPAGDFLDEYWRGIGGRWLINQVRSQRGLPPVPVRTPRARRRPATAPAPGAVFPSPSPLPPQMPRRRRPVPPRLPVPPVSARQDELRLRLHRIRSRPAPAPAPAPPVPPAQQPPPAPTPPAPRPRPARPAPRRAPSPRRRLR